MAAAVTKLVFIVLCLFRHDLCHALLSDTDERGFAFKGEGDSILMESVEVELGDFTIRKPLVTALFGNDPSVYTFKGNSSQHLSQRIFPEIGNGHVATQIGNEYIFMSGLYNGFETKSHRAGIPSTVGWHLQSPSDTSVVWEYIFDVARGVFVHRAVLNGVEVQMRSFVMRDVPSILVREVHAVGLHSEVHLDIVNPPSFKSDDVTINLSQFADTMQMNGLTMERETNDSTSTPFFAVFDKIPSTITLSPQMPSAYFITAVNPNNETAWREYLESRARMASLYADHVDKWLKLWNDGRIAIGGDLHMAQVTATTQYYLLTSLPWPDWEFVSSWPFFGLSPGGLAHGDTEQDIDYMGHVFWDQETWMYPAVMPFHPKLAQHMSDYRYYTLPKAMEKAQMNGWHGAQYPWESAFTGVETSPWDLSANNEQHVTGDISFAITQFLWMKSPDDKEWYIKKGRKIIEEISRFWASRLVYNHSQNYYEIHNVMPPDEYVQCANNSVFTNYVAAFSMRAPMQLAKYFNESPGPDYAVWSKTADKVYIPLNITGPRPFHPETDSYKLRTLVKQADVILLGYPLLMDMPPWLRRNDLDIYEQVTDPDGPAMTWSMFATGRLELKQYSEAWKTFQRSYDYVRDPFKIWTEVRSGEGAVNFATGMGGFLQSITNGYIGLRIYAEYLRFMPSLPPTATNITLHGLKYRDHSLNIEVKKDPNVIVISVRSASSPADVIVQTATGEKITLVTDISLPWQELQLYVLPKKR